MWMCLLVVIYAPEVREFVWSAYKIPIIFMDGKVMLCLILTNYKYSKNHNIFNNFLDVEGNTVS